MRKPKQLKVVKEFIRFPDGTIVEDSPMNYPSLRSKITAAVKTWETGDLYLPRKESSK